MWKQKAGIADDAIVFEQRFLAACLQYHEDRTGSPYGDVFERTAAARAEAEARDHTRLVAGAKREAQVLAALERMLALALQAAIA